MLYSKAGDEVAARALTDSMATVWEDSLRVFDDESDRIAVTRTSFLLAQARALLGDSGATSDMEEALRAYRELDRLRYELGWVIRVAATYSLLGDTDGALRHIETCLRDTLATCSAAWLRIDPWWDYLRDDQRFEELLERYDRN